MQHLNRGPHTRRRRELRNFVFTFDPGATWARGEHFLHSQAAWRYRPIRDVHAGPAGNYHKTHGRPPRGRDRCNARQESAHDSHPFESHLSAHGRSFPGGTYGQTHKGHVKTPSVSGSVVQAERQMPASIMGLRSAASAWHSGA